MTPADAVLAVPVRREFDWIAFVRTHAVWVVAFVAVITAITSIGNGFALDDVHIIVENDRVHSLSHLPRLFVETYWPPIEGASLYRPLTMVAFSLEYAIGRGSPLPFHAVSIALYGLVCAAFFRLLRTVVDLDTAILGAVLFAVHPVHTEAVANVVGQAELLVALFIFVAVSRYIEVRRRDALEPRDSAAIVALFFLALISKEHALILPALIIASEVLITNANERLRDRVRKLAPLFLAMAVVAIGFMVVRTQIVGAIRVGGSNELFDGKPFAQRALTMLNVSLDWLRLFIWPAQLSADYSFPRTRLATGF
jgi:hypothetical protein